MVVGTFFQAVLQGRYEICGYLVFWGLKRLGRKDGVCLQGLPVGGLGRSGGFGIKEVGTTGVGGNTIG